MSLRLQLIFIIISILLDMDIILPFHLNHPAHLQVLFLLVSAKFGVEVLWHGSLCDDCFLGNIWQHILMFLGLKNIFSGSLHSKPLHGLELISFSTGDNTFFCFLDL